MTRYLTYSEAAEYLSLTPDALRKRVERGQIPYIQDGRWVRFDREELDLHMRRHRIEASA